MLQSTEGRYSADMSRSWPEGFHDFAPVSAADSKTRQHRTVGEWAGDAPFARPETVEWVFPDQEIRKILATSFQAIDEVVSVCAQISADESVVWNLLKSYDRDVRTRVYEKELEICERLRMYDFDFRVTSIDLVSPAELMAGGFQQIFKR